MSLTEACESRLQVGARETRGRSSIRRFAAPVQSEGMAAGCLRVFEIMPAATPTPIT